MRNLHYKVFSYRLNDKTAENIKELKHHSEVSYNMLFSDFIKSYRRSKKIKAIFKNNKEDDAENAIE